jgi:hypothetical protein
MTIWHDGSPTAAGTAVTSAEVEYGSTNDLTLYINGSGDARIGPGGDGIIGTNDGTHDSYVEIYRDINAIVGWHCRLEGVLAAATSTAELADLTKILCLGYQNAQTLVATTAILDVHGLVISNRQTCNTGGKSGEKLKLIEDEHGATNKLFYLWLTATDSGTGLIRVYSIKGIEKQTLLFEQASAASDAQTEFNFSTRPIVALPDEHLLVQYVAGNALTAVAECMMNGKSVIYK